MWIVGFGDSRRRGRIGKRNERKKSSICSDSNSCVVVKMLNTSTTTIGRSVRFAGCPASVMMMGASLSTKLVILDHKIDFMR